MRLRKSKPALQYDSPDGGFSINGKNDQHVASVEIKGSQSSPVSVPYDSWLCQADHPDWKDWHDPRK